MKPVLLGGHERPIRDISFNKDDDFLFVGSSDRYISLWSTETNERIGTFYHEAAINCLLPSKDTRSLISGDNMGNAYVWDVNTGEMILKISSENENSPVNSIDFGISNSEIIMTYSKRTKDKESRIVVLNLEDAMKKSVNGSVDIGKLPLKGFYCESKSSKAVKTKFLNTNTQCLVAYDNGILEKREVLTGKLLAKGIFHENNKPIMDLCLSSQEELGLSSGKDGRSILFDPDTLEILTILKPQNPLRNINSGKISPLFNPDLPQAEQLRHCIIGGGQESKTVTFTSASEGGFEILIYDMITSEEMGSIGGHFSPINSIAVSNNGNIIVSGAEEGTARMHFMTHEYYELKQY